MNEDLFLCAYSHDKHAVQGRNNSCVSYAIYLIDTLGGRELIYKDPGQSCFSPIPVRPRPVPPLLPSVLPGDQQEKTGTFYVEDVYQSTESIPRGTIKSLRVIEVLPQMLALSQVARGGNAAQFSNMTPDQLLDLLDAQQVARAGGGLPGGFQPPGGSAGGMGDTGSGDGTSGEPDWSETSPTGGLTPEQYDWMLEQLLKTQRERDSQ